MYGRTVLISSDLISEVAQTADRLVVIGQAACSRRPRWPNSRRQYLLEEAFFALTEGSAEYSASNLASGEHLDDHRHTRP